jgi:hypothetical protein
MTLTNKNIFNKKHGFDKDEPHSLYKISEISGYNLAGIKTIYKKGIEAYNRICIRWQGVSKEQWAMARVYSSLNPKTKSHETDQVHLNS